MDLIFRYNLERIIKLEQCKIKGCSEKQLLKKIIRGGAREFISLPINPLFEEINECINASCLLA